MNQTWFHVKFFQWQKTLDFPQCFIEERVFLVDDLVVYLWKWYFHDFLSNLFTLRRRNVEILLLTNNGDASISKIQIPFAFEGNSRKFELNSKRKWRKIGEEGEDLAWKCFYNAFFFFFLKDLGISISFLLTAFLQLENCSSFNNRAGCKTSSNFDKLASFKRKGVWNIDLFSNDLQLLYV